MTLYAGEAGAAGLAKETTVGTLVSPPTEFIPFIPPDSFVPTIELLEARAIGSADLVKVVSQGPALLSNMRVNWDARPESIGNLLMGVFGSDTVSGNANDGYTHLFERVESDQLPSYSWWFDKGAKYPQFLGCMVNKLDMVLRTGALLKMESEWSGIGYDGAGTSKSPTYDSTLPFKFDHCQVNVDGSPVTNYDELKITLNNFLRTDHALGGSLYPAKIYSEGFDVGLSVDMYVEDTTQYNKFLAGTTVDLNFVLTSSEDISGATAGTKYRLEIDMPSCKYQVASYPTQRGVLKVAFVARAVYSSSDGYSIAVRLKNSRSSSY